MKIKINKKQIILYSQKKSYNYNNNLINKKMKLMNSKKN